MTKDQSGNLLGQAWLVLCLSLAFGAALAGVEIGLGPKIAENKRNETFGQIPSLVPGAASETSTEAVMDGMAVFEARAEDGSQVGWVVPAGGQGFADRIEILVGLDLPAERITGIYVLAQKETPGLGDFITDEERFRHWYRNQSTDPPLEVIKTEPQPGTGKIMALTGATISSDAVTDIVNRSVAEFKVTLAGSPAASGGA
ncbi:MAG: FMN-binding protein [Thermoanaerobaculales bacterium]|jgi:electron transport complex protein RnfG|nr:FMN-binding protein [Thermoanaerobaculales bacterium]